ncbi:hypothetical protein [Microcoleus sp. bin38.metabat.b11b12b14.051]|uniref:hypothetical protein n=1 Tax=Microcoleus sp. bin38.metabat.b11b12b14.051 TaxID=2742709 RepID=UPI0025F390AF|nr:hypothetical protein [Microcoleus sp. bin38.metabat.b11b12b14.051]
MSVELNRGWAIDRLGIEPAPDGIFKRSAHRTALSCCHQLPTANRQLPTANCPLPTS